MEVARKLLPPHVKNMTHLPYLGPAGCRDGHLLRRGDHRKASATWKTRISIVREDIDERPARSGWGPPMIRLPETGRRVRGWHGPGLRRHCGRRPTGDRPRDRPGTPAEEPLRLHVRQPQRHHLFRAAGGGRGPDRLADPPGLLRAGYHGHRLRHGLCHPRGHVLRRDRARRLPEDADLQQGPDLCLCHALGVVDDEWYANAAGPSTGDSRSSPIPISRRSCPPASAPTSTWFPTSPTTRSSQRPSRSGA